MSVSITIHNIPDETRDELASRAARSGRSLQEYLHGHLVEIANKPENSDLPDRVSARKQTLGTSLTGEQILSHRAADRR